MVRELLVERMTLEILALGEVTEADVLSVLEATGHGSRFGRVFDQGRNVALVYDTNRIGVQNSEAITAFPFMDPINAGLWVQFEIDGLPFVVAAVHWWSRKMPQGEDARMECARAMRQKFRQTRDDDSTTPILIIGDFNDEPFDASLTKHLHGTRDRTAAKRNGDLLYNPFWRLLGENRVVGSDGPSACAGSHFWNVHPATDWYTFDQGLVSPSLLRGVGWTLVEEATAIVALERLRTPSFRFRLEFDHLPITMHFEYRAGSNRAAVEGTNANE